MTLIELTKGLPFRCEAELLPAAGTAEAVELDARPNDFATVQLISKDRCPIDRDIRDLVASNTPKMCVLFCRSIEPSRRVSYVDRFDKSDVN